MMLTAASDAFLVTAAGAVAQLAYGFVVRALSEIAGMATTAVRFIGRIQPIHGVPQCVVTTAIITTECRTMVAWIIGRRVQVRTDRSPRHRHVTTTAFA